MTSILKSLVGRVTYSLFSSGYSKECAVCGKKVKKFIPLPEYYANQAKRYNFKYTIEEAETISEKEYSCPHCGASDRDRLYALYLEKHINPAKSYKILDIAPAPALRNYLKAKPNVNHRSADLLQEDVDDRGVDVTNMKNYGDDSFDIFICSHVLEHVDDDAKAMRELRRVLKADGFGIAMVPIITTIDAIDEDPSLTDEGERWRRFGQSDHVRLYSKKGFTDRLKENGFKVTEHTASDFSKDDFFRNGISPKSVLYIVNK